MSFEWVLAGMKSQSQSLSLETLFWSLGLEEIWDGLGLISDLKSEVLVSSGSHTITSHLFPWVLVMSA